MIGRYTHDDACALLTRVQECGIQLLASNIVKIDINGTMLLENIPHALGLVVKCDIDAEFLLEKLDFRIITGRTNDFESSQFG